MALNFPASPTNGQTYTLNGITYTYSTTFNAWKETSVINVQGDIYGAANQVFAIANAALQNTSVTLQGTLTVTGGVLALGGISSQGTSASFNIYDRNLNGTYGSFYRSNNLTYLDRKSTRLNSSHIPLSRMPSSA